MTFHKRAEVVAASEALVHETLVDRVIFAIAQPISTLDNSQIAFEHHFQ